MALQCCGAACTQCVLALRGSHRIRMPGMDFEVFDRESMMKKFGEVRPRPPRSRPQWVAALSPSLGARRQVKAKGKTVKPDSASEDGAHYTLNLEDEVEL